MDEGRPTAAVADALSGALVRALTQALGQQLEPGLYLVATPIGNLADMTVRAVAVLARADAVYAEDTRTSRRLFEHYGLSRPMAAYHDHSEPGVRAEIIRELAAGKRIALISDAGTPLVSDPGYKLVAEALAAGHRVIPVPGASAVMAAVSAAGLATDTFTFGGFLPPKSAARRARLVELAQALGTLVVFESPQRLAASLADAVAVLGGAREAAVAREITKRFEVFRRGKLAELARWAEAEAVRGEIVIVIGSPGAEAMVVDDELIRARLADALGHDSLSRAVRAVAEALGVPRSRVYDIGLKLRRDETDEGRE